MYHKIFIIALSFIINIPVWGQLAFPDTNPEAQGMSSARLEKLNHQMHKFVDDGQLSNVQTAIMRNGKLVHFDSYGYCDIDSKKPLGDDALWRIYSMTKPIVSVALMQLYEQGKFQLNDHVYDYIPEFKNLLVHQGGRDTKPIQNHMKIVDLMRHTSGLGYGWGPGTYVDSLYQSGDFWAVENTESFVAQLAKLPLYFEPGTNWRYGVSTDVLGRLVELISGESLDEYLRQHIFKPIGMDDTFFEVPDDKETRFVSNYTTTKDGDLKLVDHPSMSRYCKNVTFFSGGGGLVSSISDYLKFSQMLLDGGIYNEQRILGPKTIELMTADHCKSVTHHGGPVVLPAMGHGFGLGFTMTNDLAESAITGSEGAFGWGGAAGTYFRIDPKENLVYVMMIQLMPYNHLQAREKFQTMVYQAIVD